MESYINNNQISHEINNKYFIPRDLMLKNKKFDINYFLNNAKTKYIFNSLENRKKNKESNLFKHSTYINKSKIINNTQKNSSKKLNNGMNLSASNKKNLQLDLPSISMNSCKSSFSNIYKPNGKYLGAKTNYNISQYKSANVTSRINNRYSSYKTIQEKEKEEDINFFNVIKKIKYIKSKEKNFDFKSYLNKTKDITQRKNALIALNSDKVLKNFYTSVKAKESEDIPLSLFLTQRKEVSINNLLIKLMNIESNKLQKQEQKLSKELQKDISDINDEELKLNEYSNTQKIECKKIETTLSNLITKHENLIKEEQALLLDVKIKEFEIYKLLIDINLYRYFAKFSNTVLDGDPSKFNKQLLPDYHDFDKIDLEPIIEEVLTNYSDIKVEDRIRKAEKRKTRRLSFSVNSNKEKKYEIKYKEEGYFLYNPEFLYHKYNEIEGNILRLLTKKEKLIIKKLKREKQNNEAFSYLIDRCNDLKKEYNNICSLYNSEKNKYESDLVEKTGSHDISLNEIKYLINDLFSCVIEVFENTVLTLAKINNNNVQNFPFDDLVKHGKIVMKNLETNLNIILKEIRDERKEDRKTFEKVIKDIKIFYKIERQNLFEKNLMNENKMKRLKMLQKQNNIKIIPRRDEPPYYKGRPKKVEIDYDAIKKEEDKELIYYH